MCSIVVCRGCPLAHQYFFGVAPLCRDVITTRCVRQASASPNAASRTQSLPAPASIGRVPFVASVGTGDLVITPAFSPESQERDAMYHGIRRVSQWCAATVHPWYDVGDLCRVLLRPPRLGMFLLSSVHVVRSSPRLRGACVLRCFHLLDCVFDEEDPASTPRSPKLHKLSCAV